jgi:hypothetical protein
MKILADPGFFLWLALFFLILGVIVGFYLGWSA